MKTLFIHALLCPLIVLQVASSSSSPLEQSTHGSCSPAVFGSDNQVTITCQGLDPVLIKQLQRVLDRVARKEIDPNLVMTRLDEILRGVNELREKESWRKVTEPQDRQMVMMLAAFKGERLNIFINGQTPESESFAGQLQSTLKKAGLDVLLTYGISMGPGAVKSGITLVFGSDRIGLANVLAESLVKSGLVSESRIPAQKSQDPKEFTVVIGPKP